MVMPLADSLPPPPPPPPGPGPFYTLHRRAQDILVQADAGDSPMSRVPFHDMLAASFQTIQLMPTDTVSIYAPGQILVGRRKRTNRAFAEVPSLRALRILDAWAVDDAQLAMIGRCSRLEALRLSYLRARSLGPLQTLRNLRHLVIDYAPSLRSWDGIEALPALRTLRVREARKIATLEPLSHAAGLRGVALGAGFLKRWSVASYDPLSSMPRLIWLELDTVLPRDTSLRPLAALRGLRHLMISAGCFDLDEVARLRAALAGLDVPALGPHWPAAGLRCDVCGAALLRMSGRRGRVLCPECNAAAVKRHVARFESLVSAGSWT